MADVTAALDTWRDAAIAGSEGRKILVASVPIAANAQIAAMQAGNVRSPKSGVDTLSGRIWPGRTWLGRSRPGRSRPGRSCTVMVMRPQIPCQRPGAAPEFMRWRHWRVDHPEQLNLGCRPPNG